MNPFEIELVQEGSYFQILTALSFLTAGLCCLKLRRLTKSQYWLLALGFQWLALDELLMIHECTKISHLKAALRWLPSEFCIIFYLAVFIAILINVRSRIRWSQTSKIYAALVTICLIFAMGHDFFSFHFVLANELEEIAEFGFGLYSTLFLLSQPSRPIKAREVLIYFCIMMSVPVITLFARPAFCPRMFDQQTIEHFGPFPYRRQFR